MVRLEHVGSRTTSRSYQFLSCPKWFEDGKKKKKEKKFEISIIQNEFGQAKTTLSVHLGK